VAGHGAVLAVTGAVSILLYVAVSLIGLAAAGPSDLEGSTILFSVVRPAQQRRRRLAMARRLLFIASPEARHRHKSGQPLRTEAT
jgi:hypothetical protein